jgi:hypothetical protein
MSYDYADVDPDEVEAGLQSQVIDGARELMEDYGWTLEDVIETLRATCGKS